MSIVRAWDWTYPSAWARIVSMSARLGCGRARRLELSPRLPQTTGRELGRPRKWLETGHVPRLPLGFTGHAPLVLTSGHTPLAPIPRLEDCTCPTLPDVAREHGLCMPAPVDILPMCPFPGTKTGHVLGAQTGPRDMPSPGPQSWTCHPASLGRPTRRSQAWETRRSQACGVGGEARPCPVRKERSGGRVPQGTGHRTKHSHPESLSHV